MAHITSFKLVIFESTSWTGGQEYSCIGTKTVCHNAIR